jgi:hypothetical protein
MKGFLLRLFGMFRWRHRRGRNISLLVPFRSDSEHRTRVWEWLHDYWEHELPGAEIVMGSDEHSPFVKTAAVNRAFRGSHGDIVVILDADCYLPGSVILSCAKRIRSARRRGRKLWFIPYRHFYRLTRDATEEILRHDPDDPPRIPDPPPPSMTEDSRNSSSGHWWGALIQIMPRRAFEAAGGMDERFNQGWGGEDAAFMVAVDTLYARHRTTGNAVFHLWHPHTGTDDQFERMWQGQSELGGNSRLATFYSMARGRAKRMSKLTREPGSGIL